MKNDEIEAIQKAFAQVLRRERLAKKLSQEELAFRAGLTMRYISLLETNKRQPTLSTIYNLSRALEITMSDFMGMIEKAYVTSY